MPKISERLKAAMEMRGLKQADLVKLTGIGKSSISTYLSGDYEPKQRNIYKLAQALNISEAWLMGVEVPVNGVSNPIEAYNNIFPIKTHKVPLLGEIACGEPIFAVEDRESYVIAGTDIKADFCLKAKGDSMVNARIHDGDIVFIRSQQTVDNGNIAAVIIDNEATLKRIYYYPTENRIVLMPENPAYTPLVYCDEELNTIRILGKAIAFQSDVF